MVNLGEVLATIVYTLIGIVMMAVGYKILDWVIPADFNKLIEENNVSVGIVIAGALIGVAIIVASVVGA